MQTGPSPAFARPPRNYNRVTDACRLLSAIEAWDHVQEVPQGLLQRPPI
jgi:hypothetical protein